MISARGTKTIPLQRRKSGLDFSIKGGKEHGIGVVVSWIKEGGAAKDLMLGDEILAVNGAPLFGLTHSQVVRKLRDAGPSVLLLVRPNLTLQDVFSNSTLSHQHPHGPAKSVLPLTLPSDGEKQETPTAVAVLPRGWGRKLDKKTGRMYFENHYTCCTTWTDPCTQQPVPLQAFEWNSLPSGWERLLDLHGDIYYVNHDTQTTHWDCPRGSRQQQLLQKLREFLQAQKKKIKMEEEELEGKRKLLLEKNSQLNHRLPVSSGLDEEGEEEGEDLMEDMMVLNEEVDGRDEHLSRVRGHLQVLVAILQSAKVEELRENEGQRVGAELSLALAKEIAKLHTLHRNLLQLVDSISKLQRSKHPAATPLHYMLQLPTLIEDRELVERQQWVHVLPDRLTPKSNCELRVELVLTEEVVCYAELLQEKLGQLYSRALSHQDQRWEELMGQLATLDFQVLQEFYAQGEYTFREKLETLMSC